MARAAGRISGGPVQGAACGRSVRFAANPRRGSKNPSPGVGRGEVRRDQPQTLGCWWLGL